MYVENPKTKGSGILCAIPQKTKCPIKCKDCFFQSGRSYLEPLADNLPNMPSPSMANAGGYVVRMNDGNDSNIEKQTVIDAAWDYNDVFYNTSINDLNFPGPVVLTINPSVITDTNFIMAKDPPKNLMFVRFRVNTWNVKLANDAILYYTTRKIPVVLTFMAYHSQESIPKGDRSFYPLQKRTSNEYYAISAGAWEIVMMRWRNNDLVFSCGKFGCVGHGASGCRYCGVCLREYHATKTRIFEGEMLET